MSASKVKAGEGESRLRLHAAIARTRLAAVLPKSRAATGPRSQRVRTRTNMQYLAKSHFRMRAERGPSGLRLLTSAATN